MLKKVAMLGIVSLLTLAPSCGIVESARSKLANMPEAEFRNLAVESYNVGVSAGKTLANKLELSEQDRVMVAALARSLADTVAQDNLSSVDDVLKVLLERFGEELNNEQAVSILEDATNLLDATIGQIKLGIDGLLTMREKQLLIGLLAGIHTGVLSA